jgi:hypothetical protein
MRSGHDSTLVGDAALRKTCRGSESEGSLARKKSSRDVLLETKIGSYASRLNHLHIAVREWAVLVSKLQPILWRDIRKTNDMLESKLKDSRGATTGGAELGLRLQYAELGHAVKWYEGLDSEGAERRVRRGGCLLLKGNLVFIIGLMEAVGPDYDFRCHVLKLEQDLVHRKGLLQVCGYAVTILLHLEDECILLRRAGALHNGDPKVLETGSWLTCEGGKGSLNFIRHS